eukprot:4844751-Alexandrium_andersonii.AAC.1
MEAWAAATDRKVQQGARWFSLLAPTRTCGSATAVLPVPFRPATRHTPQTKHACNVQITSAGGATSEPHGKCWSTRWTDCLGGTSISKLRGCSPLGVRLTAGRTPPSLGRTSAPGRCGSCSRPSGSRRRPFRPGAPDRRRARARCEDVGSRAARAPSRKTALANPTLPGRSPRARCKARGWPAAWRP